MDAEVSFLEWVFRGLVGAIVTVSGYLFVKANKNSDDINRTNLDMADYKLYAEKRYIDKDTIQGSFSRLYSVLEEHRDESREAMTEIRQDIKNIIGKTH